MSDNAKMMGTICHKEFIYGNVSLPISADNPNFPENHTHEWCIYVRGLTNEDLSYYIEKVKFQIHHTYDNAERMIYEAPFEVWNSGYGEFVVNITVYFKECANVEPIELKHLLKLFPESGVSTNMARKKPVISELSDEFIFKIQINNFTL